MVAVDILVIVLSTAQAVKMENAMWVIFLVSFWLFIRKGK